MAPHHEVVDLRTLNRTMLHRQWLNRRRRVAVVEAVRHLVGLNAQAPGLAVPALAARLAPFREAELWEAFAKGELVRSVVMRGTQHVVTAEDFALLRSVLATHLERLGYNVFKNRLAGAAPAEIAERTRRRLPDVVEVTSLRRLTTQELAAVSTEAQEALGSALRVA